MRARCDLALTFGEGCEKVQRERTGPGRARSAAAVVATLSGLTLGEPARRAGGPIMQLSHVSELRGAWPCGPCHIESPDGSGDVGSDPRLAGYPGNVS